MESNHDLPASLEDVAETCGARAALALIEHFGGREMRFPKVPPPNHPIVKALGETDARAVCHLLSGMKITIPTHGAARRKQRVSKMFAEGRSLGSIARATGLTQRHVRRIVNAADPRQTDLFD